MDGTFWLIAALAMAGMIWIWRQRGPGNIERRLGEQHVEEMALRLPPD